MGFADKIRKNAKLKRLILRILMPKNQARPRFWVQWCVNPFFHKRGKRSLIRRRTRIDVLPFNRFEIGNDSTIEDFATINNGVGDVVIGERTRVGLGSVIIGPVQIGNDVMIAQNVVVSGMNHDFRNISTPISLQKPIVRPIVVDDNVWIGANSVITAGVRIGKHSVVAAGSVVNKPVPQYCVVAGNPAKIMLRYDFETNTWEPTKYVNKR